MIKNTFHDSPTYLAVLLVLTIPFSFAIPNLIVGLMALIVLFDFKNIEWHRLKTKPLVVLYLLLLYIYIKAAINYTLIAEFEIYSKYAVILIIPVLFLKVKKDNWIKIAFIVSSNALIIRSLFTIGKFYLNYHILPLAEGGITNTILVIERPYAGFMVAISVILSVEQIVKFKKREALFAFSALLGVCFIMFVSARNSFLTLLVVFGIYLLYYLNITARKKWIIGAAITLLASSIFLNENFVKRFHINENFEKSLNEFLLYEPRYIIWPCANQITKDDGFNLFFGFKSEYQIREKLTSCYGETIINNDSKKGWYLQEKFNTHNQFIGVFLGTGILGLSLLIIFFFFSFQKVSADFFAVSILTTILFFFIFENVLFRQIGCYFFSIFVAMLLKKKQIVDD